MARRYLAVARTRRSLYRLLSLLNTADVIGRRGLVSIATLSFLERQLVPPIPFPVRSRNGGRVTYFRRDYADIDFWTLQLVPAMTMLAKAYLTTGLLV